MQLGWLYLSDAQFILAAETFERMCTLNNWSHSTYLAIAAGESARSVLEKSSTDSVKPLDRLPRRLAC